MLFPRAKEEQYFEGSYKLKGYTTDLLALYNEIKRGNDRVTVEIDSKYKKEEYTLLVNEGGIKITASGEAGIFRAASTLKQLIVYNGEEIPYCEIKDAPLFERRAYMLDISRCRMPKVETIKRLIDLLADLKYNEFQLYMESFAFKYKAYPKVTEGFDCLTPEDIEYLDNYCSERFIDLVPNQNSLGHMTTWVEKDEFKHLEITDGKEKTGTINPLMPESFDFVDGLYSSLLPHFKSEYVNIGLDEAYGLGKYQVQEVCEKEGEDNVFMDWLCKLSEHINKKYNKKIQFWADMIYKYPNAYERVPKDAIALNWGYDRDINVKMVKRCRDLSEKNVPFYVCPGNQTWISFTGKHDLMNFNLYTCGKLGEEYGAVGYMLTDWGCGEGHTHFPVWSLIPAVTAGQIAWNGSNEDPRHYTRYAQEFLDKNVFHAPVSNWIRKISQYYLLEPERVPSSTMCGFTIRIPLSESYVFCFDVKKCGEPFYFENIIYYVNRCLEGLSGISFDENWKRQIFINARMVILSAELNIIRINECVSKEKKEELIKLIDHIYDEYIILWDRENYSEGKEHFLAQLRDRKKELIVANDIKIKEI